MNTTFRIQLSGFAHQTRSKNHRLDVSSFSKRFLGSFRELLSKCTSLTITTRDCQRFQQKTFPVSGPSTIQTVVEEMVTYIEALTQMPPRKNRLGLRVCVWPPLGSSFMQIAFPDEEDVSLVSAAT